MRTCLQEGNCNSRAESRLLPLLSFLMLRWSGMNVYDTEPECGNMMPYKSRKPAYRKTCESLGKHLDFFMDDWSLIGDPAPVMFWTDSAKATSGFDLGFEKAMASDLDGLRWRPFFKSQSWTLWVHDSIKAIWAVRVEEFAPIYRWVSSAYWWKGTIPILFWMSSTTGEINKTKRRGPRTEPCGRPVSELSQWKMMSQY